MSDQMSNNLVQVEKSTAKAGAGQLFVLGGYLAKVSLQYKAT